ncbi:competence protein ComL [Pandoraea anapnoica]|uniref:Outer membrane protein assembly factor BamD n=1 Tax=Pandoraea anapnoica TaxID=2508301 RepID=A0A5E4ZMM6_9BURK|nr:outer membrane protein assembly factor BamD [Pandoraea anapnoica]VVE62671.1 competence protein ComL [Pandoraea anapnoica]
MQALKLVKHLTLAAIVVGSMAACGILPEKVDETAGWSTNKLYSEAKDSFDSGDYTKAAKYYELLEGRDPFGPHAQQAQINTAYSYYKDNEPAQALTAVDRFIRLHPDSPSIDYAYYLKGLINFNDDLGLFGRFSGQDLSERDPKALRAAYDSFKYLVEHYPTSKYANDAALRMRYAVNAMAAHEVHAAEYYYRRGAYLAAVNRAQTALQDYDQAPALEDALGIMIKSYDKLGMTELRDDARRVMEKTYPNSGYLTVGRRIDNNPGDKKSWWQIWR